MTRDERPELPPDPPAEETELARFGVQVREHEARTRNEIWERFAAGEADEAGVRAALAGELDDDAIEHGLELFAPRSAEDLHARILASYDEPEPEPDAVESPAANDPPQRSNVVWLGTLVVVAAIAAAVLAVLLLRDPTLPGADGPPVASLGAHYTLETDAGSATVRSTEGGGAGPLRYVPGDRFEWVLRPDEPVDARPQLRIFVLADDTDQARRIDRPELVEIGSASVRVSGPIDALDLEPGRWTVVLVLGADAGGLPNALRRGDLDAPPTNERAWRAFRVEFDLGD